MIKFKTIFLVCIYAITPLFCVAELEAISLDFPILSSENLTWQDAYFQSYSKNQITVVVSGTTAIFELPSSVLPAYTASQVLHPGQFIRIVVSNNIITNLKIPAKTQTPAKAEDIHTTFIILALLFVISGVWYRFYQRAISKK